MAQAGEDLRSDVAEELLREMCRDHAKPGFFRLRLVKGGPYVGALIEHVVDNECKISEWRATVDGDPGEWHPDPALSPGLLQVYLHGEPCTEGEFRWRVSNAEWARKHDTSSPFANPRERYDPLTSKPVF